MKGQFFISGIVVIAVILIVSMNYANSAEELRIELGNDLAFDNYKNAYERAVPDNWEFTDYVNRTEIGICVNNAVSTDYFNTTVLMTGLNIGGCMKELNSTIDFYIDWDSEPTSCYIAIIPNEITTFNSKNCTTFYLYYGGNIAAGAGIPEVSDDVNYDATGTKFHYESIETSPGTHFLSNYRAKNIFVNEISVNSDGTYNVTYNSNQIDYTGEL